MVCFKECIEDITIPEEWEDVSYSNDEAPSWTYNGYQIHINHRDFIADRGASSHIASRKNS